MATGSGHELRLPGWRVRGVEHLRSVKDGGEDRWTNYSCRAVARLRVVASRPTPSAWPRIVYGSGGRGARVALARSG